jgi:Tfp pilus assembly protein PilW
MPRLLIMATSTPQRRRSRGISTIEILAATALTLLLLAVASSFFVSQQRMLLVQSAYSQSQNVTRTFTDLFGRELRMAGFDPTGVAISKSGTGAGISCPSVVQAITLATQDSIGFKQDLNGDGDTADANEQVTYSLSNGQILRQNGNATPIALVNGVPSGGFVIQYFNNSYPAVQLTNFSGNPGQLNQGDRDCIGKVRVRLTAQLASPQFFDIQPLISSIDSQVAVRNRSLVNF